MGEAAEGSRARGGAARRQGAVALLCTLIVVAVLAAIVAARWSVSTDITRFLADHEDAELAAISSQLADSELTRAWIITVGAGEGGEAAAVAAADALAAKLSQEPGLTALAGGGFDRAGEDFYALYYPRRFYFFSDEPEAALARLDDAALRENAREVLHQLSLPQAPLYKQIAPGDPLLTFPAILSRLRAAEAGGLHPVGDRLVSDDGHAVLFFATAASPFDGEAMAPIAAAIDRAIAEVKAEHGEHLVIEQSAVARFALAAERSIRADVTRISIVSTLGLILVFLVMLRSPRLVLLVVVPLAIGVLAAIAATLLLFGQIHGLTLAFGATLIGVAIDYSVHLFNHHMLDPAEGGPRATLRRIWPGLALGALTTIAGFLGLAWTAFPGLREMAVFACVGVASALAAVRFVLPPLMPARPAPGSLQRAAAALCGRALAAMRRGRRPLAVAVVVVVALTALGLSRLRFVDDIRAFSQIDPGLLAEDERVRGRVSRMDAGRFLIAVGDDEEAALQRSDALARRLADARAAGEVAEVRSLHALVWSAALQRRSLAALRGAAGLPARAEAAFVAEGFRAGALAPFARDLAGEPPPPLTLADLEGTAMAELARTFRVDLGDRVGVLTMVRGVGDPAALRARVADLDGVHVFDQGEAMAAAYGRYRARTIELVAIGLVLVFALVLARYRRLRLALAAFVPAVLAAAATLSILAAAGAAIHLLHVVALLLVLSMGVDYGVFLAESRGDPEGAAATVLSIILAALSTVLAFGLLAMSSFPALAALGVTIGVGVLLSLLFAPLSLVLFAGDPPRSSSRS